MRQRTQSDLIGRLEKDPPAVVVFTSDGALRSQFSLDGVANQVRYYDISRYLLDRYVPVAESHGFVFMQRRTTAVRGSRKLYFRAPSCDWGHAPNFFSSTPEPSLTRSRSVPHGRAGARLGSGIARARRQVSLARGRDGQTSSRESLRSLGS